MRIEKACLSLQAYYVLEGQRMLHKAMTIRPGDSKTAQIASAAMNLKLDFDFCWRVFQGRCGGRAFLTLYRAFRTWEAEQEQADKAAEILDRLRGLEQSLAELRDRLPAHDRGETDRALGASARLSVVRAPS